MIQKLLDGQRFQSQWMLLIVKENELAYPVSISLFGSWTEVTPPANNRELIKQAGRCVRWTP
jgi:hypothetical protein